ETFHVCLFHVAFSLAYTVIYTALEMDSPTLTIVAFVDAAGARGRTREELLGLVSNDQIVGARFETLSASGIIARAGPGYVLTPKGRRVALVFGLFRRL